MSIIDWSEVRAELEAMMINDRLGIADVDAAVTWLKGEVAKEVEHVRGNRESAERLAQEVVDRNEALQAALTRSEQLAAERAEALEKSEFELAAAMAVVEAAGAFLNAQRGDDFYEGAVLEAALCVYEAAIGAQDTAREGKQ